MFAADLLVDIAPTSAGDGSYRVELPPSWSFRAPSGGVLMSAALAAIRHEIDDERFTLLSATTVFLAPLAAGELEARVEVTRRGRTAVHARATLAPASGGAGLEVTAVLVRDRAGPDVLAASFPDVRPIDDAPDLHDGHRRNFHDQCAFFANFDIRLAFGTPWWREDAPPQQRSEFARWFRYRVPPVNRDGRLDALAIPPIADTMPAALRQRLGSEERFFAPSLDLTVHFLEPAAPDWLLGRSRVSWAGRGYATGNIEIWSRAGRLVAVATQTMLISRIDK